MPEGLATWVPVPATATGCVVRAPVPGRVTVPVPATAGHCVVRAPVPECVVPPLSCWAASMGCQSQEDTG